MNDSSSSESASPAAQTTNENSSDSEDVFTTGSPVPERVKQETEESDEDKSSVSATSERKPRVTRRHGPLTEYRKLFNSLIEDAISPKSLADGTGPLPPSQIGASFWTSDEKESFFSALALNGPGDLPALAKAVGTKSIPEIQTYVQLLEDGVVEANATLPMDRGLDFSTVPGAFEVSAEFEAALEDAADALKRHVEEHEAEKYNSTLGEEWLIDERIALKLDEEYEEFGEGESGLKDKDSDQENDPSPFFGRADDQRDDFQNPPPARLLRPSTFLHLSENIFMNGQPNAGSNWRDLLPEDDSLSGPAIVKSAFDDFYNLSISLTRRLVQACLFQTMTRLRASDSSRINWKPKAIVTTADVAAAIDILGVRPNSRTFWAKAARRCDLNVYTDINKYKDGRVGTKNGVQLTHEEVEAEMGMLRPPNDEEENIDEDDELASDDYTIESLDEDDDDETASKLASKQNSEIEEESDYNNSDDDSTTSTSPHKRKRDRSEASLVRTETAYLEALDQQASRIDEQNLWEMLGSAPSQVNVKRDVEIELPETPGKTRDAETTTDWRRRVQYRSEWEVHDTPVDELEFLLMDQAGQRGRKRRRSGR